MKNEYNRKQKLAVIILDLAILLELAVSLCWSSQFGDELTKMFLFSYMPMAIITLIIGKVCISRLANKSVDDGLGLSCDQQ